MAVRFFQCKEEDKEYDVSHELAKLAKLEEQTSKIAAFSSNPANDEASKRIEKAYSVWKDTLSNVKSQVKTDTKEEAPSVTPGFRS